MILLTLKLTVYLERAEAMAFLAPIDWSFDSIP
jgi:hypothetical protein